MTRSGFGGIFYDMLRADFSFEREMLDHRDFLGRLAVAMLRDPDSAQDAVQETWVKALEMHARDQGPRAGSERPWLATVLRNTVRKGWRTRKRRVQREAQVVPRSVSSPEVVAQRAELIKSIGDAVASLPLAQREVVMLRHFEGLPPRDIAARVGVPVNTVKSRLRLAHARLRMVLDERDSTSSNWRAVLPAALGVGPAEPVAKTVAGSATAVSGVLLMKKAAIVACIALLCGGLALFLVRPDGSDDALDSETMARADPERSPTLQPAPIVPADDARETPSVATEVAAPALSVFLNGWPREGKLGDLGLVPERQGDRVRGRVLVPEGGDLGGVAQVWQAGNLSDFLRKLGDEPTRTAIVDREGIFHFADVEPGEWYVGLSLDDGVVRAALQAVVRPEDGVVMPPAIVLGTASVHGTVYGVEGDPLPGARVRVSMYPGSPKYPLAPLIVETVTDALGRYDMTRLPGGWGHASLAREGTFGGVGKAVTRPLYLEPTKRKQLNWGTPRRMGTVRGVVLCAGQPVAQSDTFIQSFVSFRDDAPTDDIAPWIQAPYDEQGRFERTLAPGTYKVRVVHRTAREYYGGSTPQPGKIEVVEGQEREVTLVISGARIAGRIRLAGAARGPIYVHVRWRMGDDVLVTRQVATTRFGYNGLKPGRYEIWASMVYPRNPKDISDGLLSYRSSVEHVDVADGDAREVTLQLELE